MERDQESLSNSLLRWLQTFELAGPHSTLAELSDGVAVAQALHQIAPEWFTSAWLAKIKTDVGLNWRLKVSNLKKITEGIVDYYQEILNQQLPDIVRPDVTKIGEKSDAAELGKLLQLVLGCAVNCNCKQDYITRIMAMEEAVQQVIMQSIQELDASTGGSASFTPSLDTDPAITRLLSDLDVATQGRDQMAQRCHELDMQVTLLQEEKAAIVTENQRLQERLRAFEMMEDSGSGGSRQLELRRQLDTLKEEMFKVETACDDYRLKLEIREKELQEVLIRVEELQRKADEAQLLKDEVDILRETADKVTKYEATISNYKKKLDECGDMRRQLKLLEEKNIDYMRQNMELEEELKKNGTWKPQVDMFKKRCADLQTQLTEETKRADRAEFECNKVTEKLSAVQREKDKLMLERDMLKESNEELKCSQMRSGVPDTAIPSADMSEEMIPPEVKQRLLRLEHENKMLRLSQKSPDQDDLAVVQALLDEANQRNDHLTAENRRSNQRLLELESHISELVEKGEEGGTALKNHLSQLKIDLKLALEEKDRRGKQLEERDASLQEYEQRLLAAQEALARKEQAYKALEENYNKCLEKARDVVKSLDMKPPSHMELVALRSQLSEKQKTIDELRREKERAMDLLDREGQLMTAAVHSLGSTRMRESVDSRLAALNGQGQTFFARQRQATPLKLPVHTSK